MILPVAARNILNDVAAKHELPLEAIRQHSNYPEYVVARREAAVLLHAGGWSDRRIGMLLGGFERSTIHNLRTSGGKA